LFNGMSAVVVDGCDVRRLRLNSVVCDLSAPDKCYRSYGAVHGDLMLLVWWGG